MIILDWVEKYGWAGMLVLWTLTTAFPGTLKFLTEKLFPWKAEERKRQLESEAQAQRAKEEADALILQARLDSEKRQLEHRLKVEERLAEGQETASKNIAEMASAISSTNERLATLITAHGRHDRYTIAAVTKMEKTVEQMYKPRQRKSRQA